MQEKRTSTDAKKTTTMQGNQRKTLSIAFTKKLSLFSLTINTLLVIIQTTSSAEAFFNYSNATVSSIGIDNDGNQQSSNRNFSSAGSPLQAHGMSQKSRQQQPVQSRQFGDMINDIQIECNSDNIVVVLNTNHGFNGMIYPKGLSKNSTCMMEYHETGANITYYLPLRSCNTMSSDVEDGVEYFNTVMVQPHRRLVTNQGRGYHIRCRYQTKERTISNQEQQLSVNLTQATPAVVGSASMPTCSMKIYNANDLSQEVAAENVRIGDELQLTISLDHQASASHQQQDQIYGMLVTNCLVRDGMNWGEQPLLDDHGCPVDEEIMPQFKYNKNLTKASVTFQAHKFPYASSVYYQCNVKLCFRDGGCQHVPPNCADQFQASSAANRKRQFVTSNNQPIEGNNLAPSVRHKRWIDGGDLEADGSQPLAANSQLDPKSMSLEVFSGLNVNEGGELLEPAPEGRDPLVMLAAANEESVVEAKEKQPQPQPQPKSAKQQQQQSEKDFCLSLRKFAIAISLASLLLMVAILTMIACMIHRRNVRRREELRERELQRQLEGSESNYYNNQRLQPQQQHFPYTNKAFSRNY